MAIYTKEWWKAAGVRTIKTFAEAALSMLTVGQAFAELNLIHIASVSGVAALIAFFTCLIGLPEVPVNKLPVRDDDNIQ